MIDGASFHWIRSHGHLDIDGQHCCVESFSAWRDDDRRGALRVRFIDGDGGSTTAGQGWGGHDGRLLVGGVAYNLNRPALAARLIQTALAEGWQPGSQRSVERNDGFALLARSDAPAEPRR